MHKTIVLLKTKAGKGVKLCIDNEWFYASITEVNNMLTDKTKAVSIRTREGGDSLTSSTS